MRSKHQPNQNPAPIFRAINPPLAGAPAATLGAAGQAALTSAALNQLNRYADDIQAFLQEAQLDAILDRLQDDLNCADPDLNPLRSRRQE
jgi:hypothetical protein